MDGAGRNKRGSCAGEVSPSTGARFRVSDPSDNRPAPSALYRAPHPFTPLYHGHRTPAVILRRRALIRASLRIAATARAAFCRTNFPRTRLNFPFLLVALSSWHCERRKFRVWSN